MKRMRVLVAALCLVPAHLVAAEFVERASDDLSSELSASLVRKHRDWMENTRGTSLADSGPVPDPNNRGVQNPPQAQSHPNGGNVALAPPGIINKVSVGQDIEVRGPDNKHWVHSKIIAVEADGSISVALPWQKQTFLKKFSNQQVQQAAHVTEHVYNVNDKVKVVGPDAMWVAAHVAKIAPDGITVRFKLANVTYEKKLITEELTPSFIQPIDPNPYHVNDDVEVRWTDGVWVNGHVMSVSPTGEVRVRVESAQDQFFDRTFKKHEVNEANLRPIDPVASSSRLSSLEARVAGVEGKLEKVKH